MSGILGFFGLGKKEETVLPLSRPPSPPAAANLREVVVKKNAPPVYPGAAAPQMPTPTIGAATLMKGIAPVPTTQTARRGEYVALGGSRKKSKASKKSKAKSKKSKSSRSRK